MKVSNRTTEPRGIVRWAITAVAIVSVLLSGAPAADASIAEVPRPGPGPIGRARPSVPASDSIMTSVPATGSAEASPAAKAAIRRKPRKRRARKIPFRSCVASWYGPGFYGHGLAGGGKLYRTSMIVAHRTLPFGTVVRVVWKGRSAVAVVKDRGPYVAGRGMDLGPGLMTKLRFSGVHKIRYQILKYGPKHQHRHHHRHHHHRHH